MKHDISALLDDELGEDDADRAIDALRRDKELQEAVVRESGLDWTIVRPVKMTNGPRTGRVRVGSTVRWGLGSMVSRADVAAVVLATLSDTTSIGAALTVAGA
ncbi:NAD(P)H-binding protein [Piscinibacter sp.]|uniref:NAD(P)H-binding protein n=1 Tax=Piscinibacter sp. TaxID=1903157 RepID=UPI003784D5EC